MKSSLHAEFALYGAYRYFNRQLFKRELPKAGIVIDHQKSHLQSIHHYLRTASKYRTDEDQADYDFGKAHQIILSNRLFFEKSLKMALSYLVREMVSVWQHENGAASRQGYFNRNWAQKMEAIGLIPSHNGKEGGRKTGQGIGHYIETGGQYELAYHLMYDSSKASLMQMNLPLPPSKEKKRAKAKARNKSKFSCPSCQMNVWGKAGLKIICGNCNLQLTQTTGADS